MSKKNHHCLLKVPMKALLSLKFVCMFLCVFCPFSYLCMDLLFKEIKQVKLMCVISKCLLCEPLCRSFVISTGFKF